MTMGIKLFNASLRAQGYDRAALSCCSVQKYVGLMLKKRGEPKTLSLGLLIVISSTSNKFFVNIILRIDSPVSFDKPNAVF